MTKAQHKEMMKKMKASVTGDVDELIKDEDLTCLHQGRRVQQRLHQFTLTVDKEAFENSFDGFASNGSCDVRDVLSGL